MNSKKEVIKTVDMIDKSKFSQGSDTIKTIRERLIAKHGEDYVVKGMAAIEKQREITDLLTNRRKMLKINQSDIANAMEISRNQVIRYEKHQQDPSLTKFLSLCDKLGVEISLIDKNTKEIMYHT
jgi:DNA-binding XRE family transcriptional regulator